MRTPEPQPSLDLLRRRHMRVGLWSLVAFSALGLALEGLHGFKVPWYMELTHQTRRTLLTLGHAHGTLLGLAHLALAGTLHLFPSPLGKKVALGSACLVGGTALLPLGFILGGLWVFSGDPGLGVALVPAGALLVVAAFGLLALALGARPRGP